MALPASAQNNTFCESLWLSRGMVLDRAGHCFDTPLGDAVFDDNDCTGPVGALFPIDAEILRMAEGATCDMDESGTELTLRGGAFVAQLRVLNTVPVRGGSEHSCVDYQGPPIPLYAGISTELAQIGTVLPGQGFGLQHQPMRGGWDYVTVSDPDGTMAAFGWLRMEAVDLQLCGQIAG